MAEIRIERITKTYPGGKTPAVRDVSLAVADREFMVLLGPSGCGKTTLLRTIAGLEYPDAGRIVIGDRDGQSIPLDVNVLKERSLTVSAPVCFDYFDDRLYLQRLAHQLFAKIQNRMIIPAVQAFPLSQATEAHLRIESRQTMGAVVLTPGG